MAYLQGVDPNSPAGKRAIAAGTHYPDGRAIVNQSFASKGYQVAPEGFSLVHGKLQPVQKNTGVSSGTPYQQFVGQNAPQTDQSATNLGNNLMGSYQRLPDSVLSQLGQVTSRLADYKPEKIDVGKAQSMPVEYYQKQIEDLSQPLTQQYEKSRALMRGDQAARGTLYDSEGSTQLVDQIDKPYLDQLGSITRGVQLQRMQDERANEADYLNRAQSEALDRRKIGFDATQGGADLFTRTALQQAGIDANTINSLLGYKADRYGTEANLFGNIYESDTDWNKALISDATERYKTDQQTPVDLLGLQGYTDSPQSDAYNQMLYRLGLVSKPQETQPTVPGSSLPDPNTLPPGTTQIGPDGRQHRVMVGGQNRRYWT